MKKVGLNEKEKFMREMKIIIYNTPGLDASIKQNTEVYMRTKLMTSVKNIEELQQLKQEILMNLEKSKNKVVNKVAEDLTQPKKANINEINDINTLKKDNGTVITSVKTNDGSIYVKDSSYSGDIKQVVEEVAKSNPDLTASEIENQSFRVMQQRQININTTNVNNSGYDNKTKENITKLPGDNKQVSREYGIAIDSDNRITDLNNIQNGNSYNYESEKENDYEKTYVEKPKTKVLTMGKKFNDAAFVDAMLLGSITLYTGILGLCAIFSKM